MKRILNSSLIMLTLATPVLAQTEGSEAVGSATGGILGLLITIVIGALIGWVASLIVSGGPSSLLGDILIGIGGSFLAGWVLPMLGVSFGSGFLGAFIASVLGAIVLILIYRAIRKSA
ncbi:GlsB/YeaQ/YmgE family stress response membrane protein (plasmid) [Falsihalocynthiibacter sp. SS001]|uniref:GlsB/YeaQ/YmgE family stress response membrane protein n=1 Tax=Falsihalocynthiibacter sp. SS001 TaxID=3349698 RepID=UPI0036D409EC